MGLGDEIMAGAQARALSRAAGKLVCIVDKAGRPRWHDMWQGLPWITRSTAGAVALVNASGARPYIDYARTTEQRWAYTSWRCAPGEIAGLRQDLRGDGAVLIESTLKPNASPNKQWGLGNWLELVRLRPDLDWVQCCPPGAPALPGVRRIETASFRDACSVLMACRTAVLPEGGMHHAAAALDKRVVVLFGGMTSPRNTGYDEHINLWVDDPDALGWRIRHPACERAWQRITPICVANELEKLLGN